ncbi:transcription elongation factor [Protomyces lactucae-debilis]|uniref:Transcription elongation factor n=1 Tax=Protomyces lactucae-debilis TaxID=2754530 RepID=A0A1Y2F8X4_PROLT|nr:transcription elongation factor [Protomyces lactucae-debilis]ORY80360.1 transcription elongation factor [Protomyces lactucae-debilis]
MSNKDIIESSSALLKALDNRSYKTATDILATLRTRVLASDSVLRDTKIGLTVGKLRKHEDKLVAAAATELVKKWKNEVTSAKAPSGTTETSATTATGKEDGKATDGKNAAASTKTPRTVDTDKIHYALLNDAVRNNCVKLVYNGLAIDSDERPAAILEKARALEATVFEQFDRKAEAGYKQKIRSLFLNLKGNNISLRHDVLDGTLSVERLAVMTADEMASDEVKARNEALQKANIFNAMAATAQVASTDMFQCGKCKKRECTYYQMQTRSADEPMTTFVSCTFCGNKFKF